MKDDPFSYKESGSSFYAGASQSENARYPQIIVHMRKAPQSVGERHGAFHVEGK